MDKRGPVINKEERFFTDPRTKVPSRIVGDSIPRIGQIRGVVVEEGRASTAEKREVRRSHTWGSFQGYCRPNQIAAGRLGLLWLGELILGPPNRPKVKRKTYAIQCQDSTEYFFAIQLV